VRRFSLRRRSGARCGYAARLDQTGRRQNTNGLNEVIDVCVERRVVAAGARRDPPAERRELEALRIEAQRKVVCCKLRLEVRSARAALDPREPRRPVDLDDAAHAPEIDAHDGARALVGDAVHDARPTAERHERGAFARAELERRDQIVVRFRVHDDVRRARKIPAKRAHDVAVPLAARVHHAVAVGRRGPRGERRRDPDACILQLHALDRRKRLGSRLPERRNQEGRLRRERLARRLVREILLEPPVPEAPRPGQRRCSLESTGVCKRWRVPAAASVFGRAGTGRAVRRMWPRVWCAARELAPSSGGLAAKLSLPRVARGRTSRSCRFMRAPA